MPTIFEPNDLPRAVQNHVNIVTLANHEMLGTEALQVKRLLFEANAKSQVYEAVDAERFVYVIGGSGQANVGHESLPLETESVLWLEQNDTFYLQAGADGLEVLLCQAPSRE